jgi:hypothetical protein
MVDQRRVNVSGGFRKHNDILKNMQRIKKSCGYTVGEGIGLNTKIKQLNEHTMGALER